MGLVLPMLCMIALTLGTAYAQTDEEIMPPAAQKPPAGILNKIDGTRDFLSEKIIRYSKNIDEFFGDERHFQEHNNSVIQLNLRETLGQGGSRIFGFQGNAKIDLPAASKRFQLVFDSNPEQKSLNDVKKDQAVVPLKEAAPLNLATSLRFEHAEKGVWHFSSEAGVKLQLPLDPFTRARASYSLPIGEWRLKIAETIFWFNTLGLGETSQLDIERILNPALLFRATSTATCLNEPRRCDLRQDFSAFHTLSERAAWVYQASLIGANRPVWQKTEYVILARYRYRLHKKYLL